MKDEAVKYWFVSSKDDLDTAEKLFKLNKFSHSLFFLHLSLEKILKGIYLKKKTEAPPLVHDLVRLVEKCDVSLSEEEKLYLVEISTFNIAARYDDYKLKFYKKATKNYAEKWLDNGKKLFVIFSKEIR